MLDSAIESGDWGVFGGFIGIIVILAILDVILKAFAMWKSARAGQKGWFVALMVVNSIGILPAIYLLTHRSKQKK